MPQVTQAVQAGAVTSTQGSSPCPLSHALDRAVCSDKVLPSLEEHLVRSSSPIPITQCHKSAIRSFLGHYNH